MRFTKLNPLLRASMINLNDSATPSSINYAYNFGSLLGLLFTVMLVSGLLLALHYVATADTAFNSVNHIMSDVHLGYYIRYMHANGASFVFIALYAHIFRNLYYNSYKAPRHATWLVGNIIVIIAIGTAFLGYSLVYGQMSLWGATVISNLFTAVPYIGFDIATILWGAYSVGSSTLTRFYALHYALAILVIVLAITHLLILHMQSSSSPIGVSGAYDKLLMQPIFLVKDTITMVISLIAIFFIAANLPNLLGHSDNFIEANSLSTPASIVPEWYLLSYYAILRSVPNKLLGVILMLLAILWLSALVFDTTIIRSSTYKLIARILLAIGLFTFVTLIALGAKHIEYPYILTGQLIAMTYFAVLLVMLPLIGLLENVLFNLSNNHSNIAVSKDSNSAIINFNSLTNPDDSTSSLDSFFIKGTDGEKSQEDEDEDDSKVTGPISSTANEDNSETKAKKRAKAKPRPGKTTTPISGKPITSGIPVDIHRPYLRFTKQMKLAHYAKPEAGVIKGVSETHYLISETSLKELRNYIQNLKAS